jgi:hypothetical protein
VHCALCVRTAVAAAGGGWWWLAAVAACWLPGCQHAVRRSRVTVAVMRPK